ncbi:MAG: type III pantothenate kinase [Christiangramia sp.]|uniref:type III pantothenate kinase n=1 Tax=Christiangramia sp. TaxID=1931228 RepID=UPI0032422F3C
MNLVLDAGNTRVKLAVFQQDEILEKAICSSENFFEISGELFQKYPGIGQGIVSNVGKLPENMLEKLPENIKMLHLDGEIKLPFRMKYTTPQSLGKDRIALIAAAVQQYPGKNVLVIDAGTCITYDFKNSREEYLGGAISPGMQMRFKSLHKFTANLPLITAKPEADLIGNSTENSILSGIINGLKMELKGIIQSYESEFEHLTVIYTGGDSQFLSIPLKNSIFANSNFLLEGLNFILEFNINQ